MSIRCKCGEALLESAKFCGSCGLHVVPDFEQPQPDADTEESSDRNFLDKTKILLKRTGAICVVWIVAMSSVVILGVDTPSKASLILIPFFCALAVSRLIWKWESK